MGFLAPAILPLAAALVAAILATYLLRPKRPMRRISSTFLWLAALHDLEAQRPWRRIPPTLLLLLQLAAALAIVAALARPFVLTTQSTGAFTIVLLNSSASMQATDVKPSRFEQAQSRAKQLIDGLEPGHQLALVSLDAQPRVLASPTSDGTQLERALQTAQTTARPPNLQAALAVAGSLAEDHADAQIVIVSDGSVDPREVPSSFSVPTRFVGVGSSAAANVALGGLSTRSGDGRLSALARVINYGQQPATARLTLSVDGRTFDSRALALDPGGASGAEWDDLPLAAHMLDARLVDSDSFALDDAAWAVVGGDRPTRVLLVSDGNVFAERALALRPSTQVTRVSPDAYVAQNQAFDLIVLDGFVPPVLPTGASVLLLHPPTNNGIIPVAPDVGVSSVTAALQDDALLTDVPLQGVHISRARRLTAAAWMDTVINSPETPLLLVGQQGGRRVGIVGFDLHQSDLPLQPGFPVLMQHLLDWLVPRSSTATPVVQVGDSVSLAPLPESVSVDVVSPDGSRVQVAPPFPAPAFSATSMPGLYQVVQRDALGRETTSWFAANFVDPSASALKPGVDSGAPGVGARREPLKAPHEVWEFAAVGALALLALEAALAWWQFTSPTLRARTALALRLATAALLVMALLGVSLPRVVDRQATVFVADVSASVDQARPAIASFIASAVNAKHPDDAFAVVTTARAAAVAHAVSTVSYGDTPALDTSSPNDGTDLAAGLRLAGDLLPDGYRSRAVLLSDGQETTGDAVAQARALSARGVQVDVVPLQPAIGPEVLVDSVSAPTAVSEGERFTIGVRLVSNTETTGTVHVVVNDQTIADQAVSLTPGSVDLAFSAEAPRVGLLDIRVSVDPAIDTNPRNNEARSVVEVRGPPQVLLVEERPGEGDVVASALSSSGVHLDRRSVADLPDQVDSLGSYAAVILADVSAQSLSDTQQTTLRAYVRDLGRGLLAIGGDTSFGQGEYLGTPLDDALPVRSSVRSHRDQGRVAMVLVIDRSGSMADDVYHEGTTKIDMARQAALLSTRDLGPRDTVGVLAFDSANQWILPVTPVAALGPNAIERRLARLTADGGTNIYPALAAGFDAVVQTDARYKHVILMTDGMSCCGGEYTALLDRMVQANVTLSTIAVGGDADQQLLQQLAKAGDGRYYFAEHARDIPRLMTRETDLATRGPLVEGTITPRQVSPDATLSLLSAGGLPQLGGYLVTSPKDLAEVLLVSDAADPLLARWQYGLGRAVAWTSDLRGRWSQDWLQWPGAAQLFNAMVSWTIAPAQGPLRMSLRADATAGHIIVDETTPNASPIPLHAHVAQPGGQPLEMDLPPVAPGEYAGAFPISGQGTYIVRVDGGPSGSAEAGLPVAYPAEFRQVAPDIGRMQRIADAGGGHVLFAPADAFAQDLPPITTPLPLQQLLLLLAAVLLPLEVGLRRLRVSPADVLEWARHPRPIPLSLPRWSSQLPLQPPAWLPGAWNTRRPPPRVGWPRRTFDPHYGHVTPGLARNDPQPEAESSEEEEDALAAATKWLAARRGTRGDAG